MRVLNILQGTSLGGMEQSSLALMKSMTSMGFKFEVLSLTPFGALKLKLDDLNITSYDCQYKGIGGWKSFFEIRSKIHSSNAESIMMTGHSLIGMLALGRKCKGNRHLAIHFHHQGVKNFYVWKLIYFLACKKFNTITFASDFIRQEAINIYKKVERMSLVIHNPIEVKKEQNLKLKALSRTKFALPEDAIIFGNAGWLIKRKRFDVFIHLASKIKNKYPSAKFLIAGDGEEKERLIELASSLKIQDDIVWLGWQDNLEDFYNAIDFMIFNSDWDAVGLSPLEAILKGIFTIVSVKNGGIKEILKDKFNIFIHHNHDIEILSEKIFYIINNKDIASKLFHELRQEIITISNPKTIALQTANLYRKNVK